MYRQIFVPTEFNPNIFFKIPQKWYGREVEVIVFPTEKTDVKENTKPRHLWETAAKQAHLAGDDCLNAPSVLVDENLDWWTWEA